MGMKSRSVAGRKKFAVIYRNWRTQQSHVDFVGSYEAAFDFVRANADGLKLTEDYTVVQVGVRQLPSD